MASTGTLTIYAQSDWDVVIDVVEEEGSSVPQPMSGWALEFVVRRTPDGALVCSKTTADGITIGDGAATGDRATVALTDTDVLHPAGRNYEGALWRTDDGSDTPLWAGPVVIKAAAAQV